jgi:DNA-binding NarL/FixJ family response regulator
MSRAAHRYRKPMTELTPRERQVDQLVEAGWKKLDIARELGISANTVHKHIDSINQKRRDAALNVQS